MDVSVIYRSAHVIIESVENVENALKIELNGNTELENAAILGGS